MHAIAGKLDGSDVAGRGLAYFGRRYYDPEIAQWTSTDPKGQDWNLYAYCGTNPIVRVDPDGAFWGLLMQEVMSGVIMSGLQYMTTHLDPNTPDYGKGLAMSMVVGGLGGIASFSSSSISDALVSAGGMGPRGAIWTEMGVSASFAATSNVTSQAVFLAAGWQKDFSWGSVGASVAGSTVATGLRMAMGGYYADSRVTAQKLSPAELERANRGLKHDLLTDRLPRYREGGHGPKGQPGRTDKRVSDSGKDFVYGVNNWNRDKYTLIHEAAHAWLGTADVGGYNAYSFESWVFGDVPGRSYKDDAGIFWSLGAPVNPTPKMEWEYWGPR